MENRPGTNNKLKGKIASNSLAFTKNRSSDYARRVFIHAEDLEFHIWFDKHYYFREEHGDENGKREGIGKEAIQELIIKSTKHLIYYSLKIKSFVFINFSSDLMGRSERIVLQNNFHDAPKLNVIAEYHYLDANRFEVTVKTAIRKDDFYFSDGQYLVEIYDDDKSALHKKELNKIKIISNYLR
jgi:hypothetical protein